MAWQLLALISFITISVALLLQRVLMSEDKSDAVAYTLVYQFLLGAFSLIAALSLHRFVLPSFTGIPYRYLLGGVLWAACDICGMQTFKYLKSGEATILGTISSLLTVFFAIIFLHESSSMGLFIGAILVIVGVVVIITEKLNFASRRGVLFSLATSVLGSLAVTNDAIILKDVNAFTYMSIMCFLPALYILVIFPQKLKLIPRSRDFFLKMSVFCLFFAVHGITYYLAYQSGSSISVLSALFAALPIVVVILAAVFLGERKYLLRKTLSALLMALGVILITH